MAWLASSPTLWAGSHLALPALIRKLVRPPVFKEQSWSLAAHGAVVQLTF